jgi:uncharacterized protein YggU (UPF0235/DUF167 family)
VSDAPLPWREVAGGVELCVRLLPRSSRTGIDGLKLVDGRSCLALRVNAPPVEGAANAAMIDFLSGALGIPRSAIVLIAGHRSRIKRVGLHGADLGTRLAALMG